MWPVCSYVPFGDHRYSRQVGVVDPSNEDYLIGMLTMSDIVRTHAQAVVAVDDPDRTMVPEVVESEVLKL